MPANKSQVRFLFTLLAIVWGFLVGANSLLAAWSTPTAVPPNDNPDPFLSTNSNPQAKAGPLTINNDFYVIGSGITGRVGLGTTTATSARLVIAPIADVALNNASIDAGDGYVSTSRPAMAGTDLVNLNYLNSTLSASLDTIKYWTLSGSNLYASSTTYNVAIGTTTAGTAKLAVIGGNVGIGTTNPGHQLEVIGTMYTGTHAGYGDTSYRWSQYSGNASTITGGIKMRNGGGSINTGINIRQTVYSGGNTDLVTVLTNTNNTSDFYISTTNVGVTTEKFRITGGGNVGIGTTTPNSRLFVRGLGSASTTSALNIQNSSGVSSLFVRDDGNVGIGTTSPTVSLHINGHAIADTPIDPQHLATKAYVDSAAQSLWINSGEYLYASSTSWRVGIGTTSPASALHIYPRTGIEGLRIVSSNYSPLVIMSSSSVNLFRVDESGKARSSAYCDIDGNNCFNPSGGWSSDSYFVTTTPLTYNGSQGGYVAANLLCNAVVAGSHVCTTGEILDTINAGFASRIPIGAENAFWFSSGPPGYTVNANDCIGFTSNSAGDFGTIWTRTSSDNQGAGGLNSCNDLKKIACCK